MSRPIYVIPGETAAHLNEWFDQAFNPTERINFVCIREFVVNHRPEMYEYTLDLVTAPDIFWSTAMLAQWCEVFIRRMLIEEREDELNDAFTDKDLIEQFIKDAQATVSQPFDPLQEAHLALQEWVENIEDQCDKDEAIDMYNGDPVRFINEFIKDACGI
jgi:hypothetical protein